MFKALKTSFKKKPKTMAILVFLAISLVFLHMFSIWQLDIICSKPVWWPNWKSGREVYADEPFQCWLWRTTVGEAYDTLLFLNFISFYGEIAILIVLFYYLLKSGLEHGQGT